MSRFRPAAGRSRSTRILASTSRQPDHPVHRGGRHRARYYAGDDPGRRCRGGQGLRRQAQDPLDGDLRRREVDQGLRSRRVAARRDARDRQGLRRVDQGSADHARRRWHPPLNVACASSSTSTSACARCSTSPACRARSRSRRRSTWSSSARIPRTFTPESNGRPIGGREEARRFHDQRDGRQEDPLSRHVGIGIKPVSSEGTERLERKAIRYAIDNDRQTVTIVHKGNIMKFTEGGFRDWGYALAQGSSARSRSTADPGASSRTQDRP